MPPENRRRRKREVRDPTLHMSDAERTEYLVKQHMKTPIAEMGLPVRIVNALEGAGMLLAEDVLKRKRDEIAGIKNFGEKTLCEIITAVQRLGLPVPENWLKPKKKEKKPRGTPKDPGFFKFGW